MLASTLFNLYTNDLPVTHSRKFVYADDICCCVQVRTFEQLKEKLNYDMVKMSEYCKKWRLIPSSTKSVTCVFHLHNASIKKELCVKLDNVLLKHEFNPVYLGVELDRSLCFKEHIKKTSAKVKTRNNLLQNLAGTSWGADASVLRTSALALCYSAAEYSAPEWCRSANTDLIDTQLNSTMRIVSGTIRSTPTP